MDKLVVHGNANLSGFVSIPGAKNSTLPIMACALLSNKRLILNNVPNLVDIKMMAELLRGFGVKVSFKDNNIQLLSNNIKYSIADYDLVRKMRASILILGPLISRFQKVKISLPGGCAIGTRPIDLHLEGLKQLGANFVIQDGYVIGEVKKHLIGNTVKFPFISVGATINVMLAAILAKGETKILNAAKEPEVIDLANCLNKMGAQITGMGTSRISIKGTNKLISANHKIIPDRIVAGTYIIAAVMLNKNFIVKEINSNHLNKLITILKNIGANLEIKQNYIKIKPSSYLKGVDIKTEPYPGFPTDLQAQIMALLSIANGKSKIQETIFENRFLHVPELNRLGAKISVKNDTAFVSGNRNFKGAQVMASDLRASITLLLAGLAGEGITTINRLYHLDRGYEKIEEILGKCGPKIKRIKE